MSNPTVTLEFSARAYLAFSSNSFLSILLLVILRGDLSVLALIAD